MEKKSIERISVDRHDDVYIFFRERESPCIISSSNTRHVIFMTTRCKHSKMDQTSAPVYESRGFLDQILISSRFFFMITSIVTLGTQI